MTNKYYADQPAFPLANDRGALAYLPDGQPVSAQGLTLRAHFAGLAMQSCIDIDAENTVEQAARELGIEPAQWNYRIHWPKLLAKRSVVFADALIEELNKS